jgi:Ca-activated chloride channel family protein
VAVKARDATTGTIVARGAEVSIDFNPATAGAWRLIGYEHAPLSAGETASFPADVIAGRTATAFYEIVPASSDPRVASAAPKDLFTVTVRYREANDAPTAARQSFQVLGTDAGNGFDRATEDFRFAAAVASFGMLLRDSQFKGNTNFADVIRWATAGKGPDESHERAAFIELAKHARDLK